MKNQTYKLDLQLFSEDQEPEKNPVDPNKNLIEAMKELQKNTVPKTAYEALEKQNRELINDVLNERKPMSDPAPQQGLTIQELRNELYGPNRKDMTNLEYWDKTLKLRDLVMAKGEADPFAPNGKYANAEAKDYLSADTVAKGMRECIEAADGDPALFNNELTKRGLDKITYRPQK